MDKVLDDLAIEPAQQVDVGPFQHLGQPPARHGVGVVVVAAERRGGACGCPRRRSGGGARGRGCPGRGRAPRSCPRDSPAVRPSPVPPPGRRSRPRPRSSGFPRPRIRHASGSGSTSCGRQPGSPGRAPRLARPATISAWPEAPGTSPMWNWVPRSQLTSNGSSSLGGGVTRSGRIDGQPVTVGRGGLLVAEPREDHAPGAAVPQDRVVAQPPHGNHDIGVGQACG